MVINFSTPVDVAVIGRCGRTLPVCGNQVPPLTCERDLRPLAVRSGDGGFGGVPKRSGVLPVGIALDRAGDNVGGGGRVGVEVGDPLVAFGGPVSVVINPTAMPRNAKRL